jgi:hypothetical protein
MKQCSGCGCVTIEHLRYDPGSSAMALKALALAVSLLHN